MKLNKQFLPNIQEIKAKTKKKDNSKEIKYAFPLGQTA